MHRYKDIWQTLLTITISVVTYLCVFTQMNVDVSARTRTEILNCDTTLIGNLSWKRYFITELSGSGRYRIDLPLEAPFFFTGSTNDLFIRRESIWLDIRFQPIFVGQREGVMRLVRDGDPSDRDTIIIRFVGQALTYSRTEVRDLGEIQTGDTSHCDVRFPSNMADQESWKIIGLDNSKFTTSTPLGPNIEQGNTAAFHFACAPLRSGPVEDTVLLERSLGTFVLDTITVILKAQATDLNVRAVIDYQTIVTGDSAATEIVFPAATPGNSRYRLIHRPTRPFVSLMIGNEPSPEPPNQAKIGIAFVPVVKTDYADSIVIARSNLNDEILDTIKIVVIGKGGGLPEVVVGSLDNVIIDQESSLQVDAVLGGKPQTTQFEYTLAPLSQGPISGTISSPVGASLNQVITCDFVTRPTTFFDATQQWVLRRVSSATGKLWDTSLVNIRQNMKARPVNYRIAFGSSELRHRIGDTVEVNLLLITDDPIDVPMSVYSISGSVTYNPTVVVPLTGIGVERVIIDDQPRIQFRYVGPTPISTSITVVGTLRFVVVMGDTDRTKLDMQRVEIVRGSVDPEEIPSSDAELIVTNVWRYSGSAGRFVNPMVGPLVMDVDPNPITSEGVLRVRNVPPGAGNLQIIDASGQIIADLTKDLRAGTTSWSISTGEGGILSLSPGSYYVRLMAQGDGPHSINSLVRLFVVQ